MCHCPGWSTRGVDSAKLDPDRLASARISGWAPVSSRSAMKFVQSVEVTRTSILPNHSSGRFGPLLCRPARCSTRTPSLVMCAMPSRWPGDEAAEGRQLAPADMPDWFEPLEQRLHDRLGQQSLRRHRARERPFREKTGAS